MRLRAQLPYYWRTLKGLLYNFANSRRLESLVVRRQATPGRAMARPLHRISDREIGPPAHFVS